MQEQHLDTGKMMKTLTMQMVGGTASAVEAGKDIICEMLAVASGEMTKSEALGVGEEEFAPWQTGVLA